MKNAWCLLLLAFLVSCQTDQDEDPQPADLPLLRGEWVEERVKLQYFNAARTMVHEQVLAGSGGDVYTFRLSDFTITYPDGGTDHGTYVVQRADGATFVEITTGGLTNLHEIITLTATQLVWQEEYPSRTYFDGSQPRTAAQALAVQEFSKR